MHFMTMNLKRRKLENSAPINWNLTTADPSYIKFIDALTIKLSANSKSLKTVRATNITKHLSIIVLNLWSAWLQDPKRYIAISRDKKYYSAFVDRYNHTAISFKAVKVIDALFENNFIDFVAGQNRPNLKRRSRIRPRAKLINQIIKRFKIYPTAIQLARNSECIVMHDADKNDVDYRETKNTKQMRADLTEYNNLLRRTQIDIPTFPNEGIKQKSGIPFKINFEDETNKFTRRIFNNKLWKEGGRFYGGWWQQIPNNEFPWRSIIRINNKPTIEIDYSGIHIVLLYAMKKIDYWNEIKKDPYDLSDYGYVMDKNLRELLKVVLLVSINAKKGSNKDYTKAQQAVQKEINLNRPDEFAWVKKTKLNIPKLIKDFADYHKPIRRYFYSGKGVSLQYLDSVIAENVINHFTRLNIPVLCIHDSYIIQRDASIGDGEKSLEWMMWCFFQQLVKSKFTFSANALLKSKHWYNQIAQDIVIGKKINKEYWQRVARHKNRKFVLNWYN
jgi:hypothetical protein